MLVVNANITLHEAYFDGWTLEDISNFIAATVQVGMEQAGTAKLISVTKTDEAWA